VNAVPHSHPGEVDIGMLVAILVRQWLMIAAVTALVVGAGFVYVTFTPKVWQSTARVLLDPRDKQIAGPGLSQPLQGVDTVWVDTQANVVTSAAILSAVIDKLGLATDDEFGGSRDDVLRSLVGNTVVKRADQTYVLDISVRSRSADKAARIAEALAEEFVANQIEVKQAAARDASQLINRQLDELRSKARTAQEKLETYKRDNGIVTANGKSVDEDTLRQLNDAYVAARVRTQDARARRDKIVAARAGNSESSLGGLDSSVLSRLKIERALAARSVGELSQELGPSHPRMVAARGDLARADAQIADELKSMAATAENEFQVAVAAEASARKALDDASATVTDTGERAIELRELTNEATLRADMYKAYVTRTEEISLQANTQVSDSRVIAPANVPLSPFSPRKTIILALAGIAGLGLALSLAIYRGRRFLPEFDTESDQYDDQPAAEDAWTGDHEPALAVALNQDVAFDQDVAVEEDEAIDDSAPAIETADAPALAEAEETTEVDNFPPVLAELGVALQSGRRDRSGRPLPSSPRDVLASAVATEDGAPLPAGLAALGQLTRRVRAASGDARVVAVLGADAGPAAAAVAYGLAHVPVRGGALLIDASWDELALAQAFADEPMPGIVDVVTGRCEAADAAICERDTDITLVGIGEEDLADEIATHIDRISDFIDTLAGSFGRVVLNFGHRHSRRLFQTVVEHVDAVLIVADSVIEDDDEAADMVRLLADEMPAFTGMVLVHERVAQTRSAALKA